MNEVTALILAAGHGSRMKSKIPKYAHKVSNFSLLFHCIIKAQNIGIKHIVVVAASAEYQDMVDHIEEIKSSALISSSLIISISLQINMLGSADAVKCAQAEIVNSNILVMYCDTPFVGEEALKRMINKVRKGDSDLVVLGFKVENPGSYGRLEVAHGHLKRIIEAADLADNLLSFDLCNSGVIAIKSELLWKLLGEITNDNNTGEFYLTSIIEVANQHSLLCTVEEDTTGNPQGVNTKFDLAQVESYMQNKLRQHFLSSGVTLMNPDSVFFSFDTEIEADVVVEPFVHFDVGVKIKSGTKIRSYSYLSKTLVEEGSNIGPFARVRNQTVVGARSNIGCFVEVKNSNLGYENKVAHLSYIGDTISGNKNLFGAGTVTCNYDGYKKHITKIGENCFIGSNSTIIAPITIGNNVIIGAGSVINKSVDHYSLAIARTPQVEKAQWVKNKSQKIRD